MKIKEVCHVTGLTKKAIDYYQQKGIIDPDVDESGYREFDELDVERLKYVSVLRSLGLSVPDTKKVLDSKFPQEELKKCAVKKKLEDEVSKQQTQLLGRMADGEDVGKIQSEISELNKKKSIKEKLLGAFPGFYGRFFFSHFSQFLGEPIETAEQRAAYETIIRFLDELEIPGISNEIMSQFEEAMDFWTDERIAEVEGTKRQSLENPEAFFENYSEMIDEYQRFKESTEYQSSPYGQMMEAMKELLETSGYNHVFIPAMRKLSPSYENYYQNLMQTNEKFMERFPDYQ